MANITCPSCSKSFDNNAPESLVTRTVAAAAFAGGGAYLGAGIGVAGGPFGAMAGTIPGALLGASFGWLIADQVRRCPSCGKVFKT